MSDAMGIGMRMDETRLAGKEGLRGDGSNGLHAVNGELRLSTGR